ncbi:DUF300 domain protein [Cordyceps fumosorosea ARSEF 2679]|uniref:DUF300 domain protein n=1 Tax=Cordyceps fumosorosea (strain ARSEF 2679) TaxID=1081104 RepID=A0A167V8P0_CORFA|nr:DUF300 domain protein [Cordyceps fumosorosea ARSEF 2679]OAA62346.1 DUF300 domain protein [Cordyceps fumosorosea ARSEF 2679]
MNNIFVVETLDRLPNSGSSTSPEAHLISHVAPAVPRKKKWTTRARTGCLTCRARRVKCDEARPDCRRCTTSRIPCRGYELPPPDADGVHVAVSGVDIAAVRREKQQKHGVATEIEPPSWDYLEAIRYYFEVARPGRVAQSRTKSFRDPPFHSPTHNRTAFIGQIICDQISKASKSRRRLLVAGEDAAFEGSWNRYARNMVDAINMVNQRIQDEALYPNEAPAFMAIRHLLVLDLYLRRVLWRAHLRGVIAYIQHRGGIKEVLKLKDGPLYLNFAVENIIHANTTSPAKQQVEGLEHFTDAELKASLSNACFAPCPLELYPLLVHITRLRVAVAHRQQPPGGARLARKVQGIFDATWRFDPGAWAESDAWRGEVDTGRLMGRLFPVAVRLYGIQTLPRSAVVAWADSAADVRAAYEPLPGRNALDSLRIRHRGEILALIRKHWDTLQYKTSLVWPLLVAGVAAADGAPEDREYIEDCLEAILAMPITACSFITVIDKLRAFWRSGKTEWEECWDEPVVGSA